MNLSLPRPALVVTTMLALMLALGTPSASGGPGEQRSFVAHLQNIERAVIAAEAQLDSLDHGVVGRSRSIEATTAALAASSDSLSDADLAELSASGLEVSQRVGAVSTQIAALLADPRLAQLLGPDQLATLQTALASSRASLQLVTVDLNPSLVLWNTLGSAVELESGAVGGPGTLTIPGASFVAGRYGGGVLIPPNRAERSEQLRFGDYSVTPAGTIEIWFNQDGYDTVLGQPDDGRFHSFWGPDIAPYDTRGASLLTYQVPNEGWHFDIWDGDNYVRNTVTPDITAGEWHHVAFTWSSEGSYTEVYLDGVLLNRVVQPLSIVGPVYLPMQLGFDWDADDRGATSVLDNLKIWSEAKTDFSDRLTE